MVVSSPETQRKYSQRRKKAPGVGVVHGNTTGMAQYTDGQRLRRRPNVGVVGVGHGPGSPRNWPSASNCRRRKIATPTVFSTPTAMPSA
jgi:hypothetical protein